MPTGVAGSMSKQGRQGHGVAPIREAGIARSAPARAAFARAHDGVRRPGASLLALMLTFAAGTAAAQVKSGDIPPDALGSDRDGNDVRISAHRGKVVIVTFWASWCAYCLKELPVLDQLQRAAGKPRLEIVAVNYKEDRRYFRAMRRRLKDAALTLTSDPRGSLGDEYGVKGLPHLVMIDKTGKVAHVHTGYGEKLLDRLIEQINWLLAQPAQSTATGDVAGPSAERSSRLQLAVAGPDVADSIPSICDRKDKAEDKP